MSDYGVTDKGFVRKRFDTILEEMQSDIKDGTGIDISVNQKSYLNVIVSLFADKLTEMWELAEMVYFSHYPSTAEGINLDYACQFGGVFREEDERSQYTILCTGVDGTAIAAGTRIASDTSPQVFFKTFGDYAISRNNFNKVKIRVAAIEEGASYNVYLDDTAYTYLSGATGVTEEEIINGLKDCINDESFNVSVEDGYLIIESKNIYVSHVLALSENLTTKTVSSLIVFQSEEYGSVVIPNGLINKIITTIVGFESCYNLPSPVYGRLRETDIELRQSYINKRALRSCSMLDSIVSAILKNVAGVKSCVAYENSSDETDENGRPPHSIEILVDGGSESEIGQQILLYKPAGIQTHGSISVDVPSQYSDTVKVKFNRPTAIYAWLKVVITPNPNATLMTGYEDIIKDTIVDNIDNITEDQTTVLQMLVPYINEAVSGIAYISIVGYTSNKSDDNPKESDYKERFIVATARQKVYVDKDRISVEVE